MTLGIESERNSAIISAAVTANQKCRRLTKERLGEVRSGLAVNFAALKLGEQIGLPKIMPRYRQAVMALKDVADWYRQAFVQKDSHPYDLDNRAASDRSKTRQAAS